MHCNLHENYYKLDDKIAYESYPFGSPLRKYNFTDMNVGFNGKRMDNELSVEGGHLDFGARIYDSRVGRWLNVDPMRLISPEMTPYRFGLNSPIRYNDPNGKYETDGHYWTIYLIGTMLGLENAEEIARAAEMPDTDIHGKEAQLNYTWANIVNGRHVEGYQQHTHALTGGDHSFEEFTTSIGLLNAGSGDIAEFGRLLHRYGDTYAHSRLDGSGRMYGKSSGFTDQHAYSIESNGSETGLRPDMIGLRPELYKSYVSSVAEIFAAKFNVSLANFDMGIFEEMAEFANNSNGKPASLIGIINYEVAKAKGENSFNIQFAEGIDIVENRSAHDEHIANTAFYLNKKGVKFEVKENYSKSFKILGINFRTGYQGVTINIKGESNE